MGMFRWTEAYAVHVANFDRHHQTLFRAIDDLYEALRAGRGTDVVGTTLQRLIDYTTAHFAAEETAMEKNGYPGLRLHKAEHQGFIEQVLKLQKDFQSGKPGVSVVLMRFLQKWLRDHIMQTDKKYGPFLNGKGIR